MRRIIHNTTAIAACLSLLAPHASMAQTAAPKAGAEEQAAETLPLPEAEAEAGAPAEAEVPTEAEAAADEPVAEEPVAEEVTDQAPAPDAAAEAEAEPAAAEPAAAEEAPAEEPAAEVEAEPAVEAETAEPAAEPEAEAEAQDTPAEAEAEAEPVTKAAPMAAEEPATEPAEAAEPKAEEATTADEAEATDKEALEKALAEEAEPEAAADTEAAADAEAEPEATTEPAEADAGAETSDEAAAVEAETEAETAPADDMTDKEALEKALAEQSGEDAETADPAAEGEAKTEAETTAETDANTGEQAAAESAEQAPEQDAKETEAAKEAAEATEAPTAAALNDDATDGEITEEQVTEENSRSSDEDFATSLRDALAGSTGQQETASNNDDDDDDNDLGKALLLGLGGVAVGAMLSNNRQVELSSPDRVVVTRADGSQQIIKDEVALLRQPGSTVTTENFTDGSSRTIVTRADGSKVVTIRDADLRVLRRTLVSADGTNMQLIDDTVAEPVDLATLPAPVRRNAVSAGEMSEDQLRAALLAESAADRRFTLAQIRDIPQVRALVAPVDIDAITFETGSAAIKSDQAEQLSTLGDVIRDAIKENPQEVFMIEGYTDTVGSDAANLALSDRRAESVALALTEYFDVPPENMVVQGYGEQFLKVKQEGDIRDNRRASVRRITDLLQSASN